MSGSEGRSSVAAVAKDDPFVAMVSERQRASDCKSSVVSCCVLSAVRFLQRLLDGSLFCRE